MGFCGGVGFGVRFWGEVGFGGWGKFGEGLLGLIWGHLGGWDNFGVDLEYLGVWGDFGGFWGQIFGDFGAGGDLG